MATSQVAYDGLVSGTALVMSGMFPWVRDGAGSSLRGMELAAALRSSAGMPDWAPRAAIGIIALALLGTAHLGSSLSRGVVARRFRFVSGLLVTVALTWVALQFAASRWGTGLLLAAVGAVVAVVAGIVLELRAFRSSPASVYRGVVR